METGGTTTSESSTSKKVTQDSEDSSYDSDCEVSDGTTHYDVSRTVSDTLGQEFAEYVTLESHNGHNAQTIEDSDYLSRLEFAKKLGYTESQVKIALSKLGPSPPQNELLNELILLDSSSNSPNNYEEPTATVPQVKSLRHIVIDGSNVAMSHGNNKLFSCRGIQLSVDYFKSRGHKDITVFVPLYRKETPKPDDPVSDQEILHELEKTGILVYTPSRQVNNRRLICYDDRYVLKLAVDVDGIVVSNDNYRDLTVESGDFKRIIEERILMYSFVNDRFMPPEDPLGRNGPTLDQFLSTTPITTAPPCPYGRKCTYGQKCKYYHVTQQKSITETLRKAAAAKTQSVPISKSQQPQPLPICRTKSALVPMESSGGGGCGSGSSSSLSSITASGSSSAGIGGPPNPHRKLQRQLSINPVSDPRINYLTPFPGNPGLGEVWSPPDDSRMRMFYHLSAIFPEGQVRHVMSLYPEENDPGFICRAIVNIFK